MLMTFFLIFLWQWSFISFNWLEGWKVWSIPAMLGNPVFVSRKYKDSVRAVMQQ